MDFLLVTWVTASDIINRYPGTKQFKLTALFIRMVVEKISGWAEMHSNLTVSLYLNKSITKCLSLDFLLHGDTEVFSCSHRPVCWSLVFVTISSVRASPVWFLLANTVNQNKIQALKLECPACLLWVESPGRLNIFQAFVVGKNNRKFCTNPVDVRTSLVWREHIPNVIHVGWTRTRKFHTHLFYLPLFHRCSCQWSSPFLLLIFHSSECHVAIVAN